MASSRAQRPTVTTETVYSQAESLGTSKEYARRDHTHGTPDSAMGGSPPFDGNTYAFRNGRWVSLTMIPENSQGRRFHPRLKLYVRNEGQPDEYIEMEYEEIL